MGSRPQHSAQSDALHKRMARSSTSSAYSVAEPMTAKQLKHVETEINAFEGATAFKVATGTPRAAGTNEKSPKITRFNTATRKWETVEEQEVARV